MHKQQSNYRRSWRLLAAALCVVPTLAVTAAALPLGLSSTVLAAPDTTPEPELTDPTDPTKAADCPKGQCLIDKYVDPAIKGMIALAGIALVGSVVVGGIQYSAAGADPSKVAAAKGRIYKAIFVFLFFIFLYAFLQWLVPGGI